MLFNQIASFFYSHLHIHKSLFIFLVFLISIICSNTAEDNVSLEIRSLLNELFDYDYNLFLNPNKSTDSTKVTDQNNTYSTSNNNQYVNQNYGTSNNNQYVNQNYGTSNNNQYVNQGHPASDNNQYHSQAYTTSMNQNYGTFNNNQVFFPIDDIQVENQTYCTSTDIYSRLNHQYENNNATQALNLTFATDEHTSNKERHFFGSTQLIRPETSMPTIAFDPQINTNAYMNRFQMSNNHANANFNNCDITPSSFINEGFSQALNQDKSNDQKTFSSAYNYSQIATDINDNSDSDGNSSNSDRNSNSDSDSNSNSDSNSDSDSDSNSDSDSDGNGNGKSDSNKDIGLMNNCLIGSSNTQVHNTSNHCNYLTNRRNENFCMNMSSNLGTVDQKSDLILSAYDSSCINSARSQPECLLIDRTTGHTYNLYGQNNITNCQAACSSNNTSFPNIKNNDKDSSDLQSAIIRHDSTFGRSENSNQSLALLYSSIFNSDDNIIGTTESTTPKQQKRKNEVAVQDHRKIKRRKTGTLATELESMFAGPLDDFLFAKLFSFYDDLIDQLSCYLCDENNEKFKEFIKLENLCHSSKLDKFEGIFKDYKTKYINLSKKIHEEINSYNSNLLPNDTSQNSSMMGFTCFTDKKMAFSSPYAKSMVKNTRKTITNEKTRLSQYLNLIGFFKDSVGGYRLLYKILSTDCVTLQIYKMVIINIKELQLELVSLYNKLYDLESKEQENSFRIKCFSGFNFTNKDFDHNLLLQKLTSLKLTIYEHRKQSLMKEFSFSKLILSLKCFDIISRVSSFLSQRFTDTPSVEFTSQFANVGELQTKEIIESINKKLLLIKNESENKLKVTESESQKDDYFKVFNDFPFLTKVSSANGLFSYLATLNNEITEICSYYTKTSTSNPCDLIKTYLDKVNKEITNIQNKKAEVQSLIDKTGEKLKLGIEILAIYKAHLSSINKEHKSLTNESEVLKLSKIYLKDTLERLKQMAFLLKDIEAINTSLY